MTYQRPNEKGVAEADLRFRRRHAALCFLLQFSHLFELFRQANLQGAFPAQAVEQRLGHGQGFAGRLFSIKEIPPGIQHVTFVQIVTYLAARRKIATPVKPGFHRSRRSRPLVMTTNGRHSEDKTCRLRSAAADDPDASMLLILVAVLTRTGSSTQRCLHHSQDFAFHCRSGTHSMYGAGCVGA